ncbi:MAG: glycosyltransferase family 2 protein [Anaerolineales bacterium]
MKVWAVLPAYNEAEALPLLLAAYRTVRGTVLSNLQVFVIDDGSTDRTANVVSDFGADWVELVSHTTNQGLAQGMRTGFAVALERAADGDVVVAMDADNTHLPEQAPAMVTALAAGADVVIASRFQPGARMAGIPWFRRLFSWGVSVLFSTLTPIAGVRDFSCGFRAYSVKTLRAASAVWGDRFITEDGFACQTEILYKLDRMPGVKFAEIPMDLRYDRKPGPTKMSVGRNIRDMLRLMWRQRWNPPTPPGEPGK